MEYRKNIYQQYPDEKIAEIQSMLNQARSNADLLLKADSSLPLMLGDPHYFQTIHHRNYVPSNWQYIMVDGFFGVETENSVKCFQEFFYITVNGIMGDYTYAYLSKFLTFKFGLKENSYYCSSQIRLIHPEEPSWENSKEYKWLRKYLEDFVIDMVIPMIEQAIVSGGPFTVFLKDLHTFCQEYFSINPPPDILRVYEQHDEIYNGVYHGARKRNSYSKSTKAQTYKNKAAAEVDNILKGFRLLGTATASVLDAFISFSEVFQLLRREEDTEQWRLEYEDAVYRAWDGYMKSIIAGLVADLLVRVLIGVGTGGAVGAAVGAAGAAVGAVPGAAAGAAAGARTAIITWMSKVLAVAALTTVIKVLIDYIDSEIRHVKRIDKHWMQLLIEWVVFEKYNSWPKDFQVYDGYSMTVIYPKS